jgi:MFS-type transporter involved in bile tolerance (Atg22 family)
MFDKSTLRTFQKMSISRTVHSLLAWILPRHFKRFMSFLAVIGIVIVLWKIIRRGPSYNYAVACKARIADVSADGAESFRKYFLKNIAKFNTSNSSSNVLTTLLLQIDTARDVNVRT